MRYHNDSSYAEKRSEVMTDILVRNVNPKVLKGLKERAKLSNRSLQAELSSILAEASGADKMDMKSFLKTAARIRASLVGKKHTDSVLLIREGRK